MRHRVFIGLNEVAGYFGGLRQGFDDLGVPTLHFDGSAHRYGYARPDVLGRAGQVVDRLRARRDAERRLVRRTFWRVAAAFARVARAVLKLGLLSRAILSCDAFIFASGESFFRHLDLVLLRALRKRVIIVFLGSDHRPPYLDGGWVRSLPEGDLQSRLEEIRLVRDRVRTAERFADAIVASGASAQFHVRPFAQFIAVGLPGSLPPTEVGDPSRRLFTGSGVRVLHAPSDPISKGTNLIRAAITALGDLGYAIDYVELARCPHADVLAALRECDLVVDQVYSDAPMAMFSAEAAFFGKPALVTGYYADVAGTELRAELVPPSMFGLPHELQDNLQRLVADQSFREDLGRRAQAYVRTRWAAPQVAQRYLMIIEGKAPAAWMVDPLACRYLHGWGISDALRRDVLRRIVGSAGPQALCLTDRPDLEQMLMEAAT